MVFGNKGDTSASGVAFSRDEMTGAPQPSGDFLLNAQGEDVVSGVRNDAGPRRPRELMPDIHAQLLEIMRALEHHYRDMQDVEFTIEEGVLYMLQTRSAKRTAQAAVRVAVDMVEEGVLTRDEALLRIEPDRLDALLHPTFDPAFKSRRSRAVCRPRPAPRRATSCSRGVARRCGRQRRAGRCLVRGETTPDDIHGLIAAQGILTAHGGKTSHAALVARGMGQARAWPGSELAISRRGTATSNGTELPRGRPDHDRRHDRPRDAATSRSSAPRGSTTTSNGPRLGRRAPPPACARERRHARGRARPASSAPRASACAAPSTCSCRRSAAERCAQMIMAATEDGARARRSSELLPIQQQDFEGIFEAMDGLPGDDPAARSAAARVPAATLEDADERPRDPASQPERF